MATEIVVLKRTTAIALSIALRSAETAAARDMKVPAVAPTTVPIFAVTHAVQGQKTPEVAGPIALGRDPVARQITAQVATPRISRPVYAQ